MTSRPLFIRVAESIVILDPIFQFGCFNASSGVTFLSIEAGRLINGPPDAVSISLFISSCLCPWRHWKIALCSLSTGRILIPLSSASFITISPAITRVSLLARAISLPALIADIVGIRPTAPTSAETTISTSGKVATLISPSTPLRISNPGLFFFISATTLLSDRETTFGLNFLIWSSSRALFCPAASPTTSKNSGNLSTI